MFAVAVKDKQLHPKEQVICLSLGGEHKAYPFAALSCIEARSIEDSVGGRRVPIEFDPDVRTGRLFDAQRRKIPTLIVCWLSGWPYIQ